MVSLASLIKYEKKTCDLSNLSNITLADGIVSELNEANDDMIKEVNDEMNEAFISDAEEHESKRLLIAYTNNNCLVGLMTYECEPEDVCRIHNFATKGNGIGTLMWKEMLSRCKKQNIKKIILDSLGDFKTRYFYFKLGMMDTGLVQDATGGEERAKRELKFVNESKYLRNPQTYKDYEEEIIRIKIELVKDQTLKNLIPSEFDKKHTKPLEDFLDEQTNNHNLSKGPTEYMKIIANPNGRRRNFNDQDKEKLWKYRTWFNQSLKYTMEIDLEPIDSGAALNLELDEEFMRLLCLSPALVRGVDVRVEADEILAKLFISK